MTKFISGKTYSYVNRSRPHLHGDYVYIRNASYGGSYSSTHGEFKSCLTGRVHVFEKNNLVLLKDNFPTATEISITIVPTQMELF